MPLAARTGATTDGEDKECKWWLLLGRMKVAVAPESRMAVGEEGACVDEGKDKVKACLL